MSKLSCFKAYDIRGRLGSELNGELAYKIGRAFSQILKAHSIVIGGDARHSSEPLKQAVIRGLLEAGTNVIDLGLTGSEEIYFAAHTLDVDGGIEITGSHNPVEYNGMKLVGRGAKPISSDTGLNDIRDLVASGDFLPSQSRGELSTHSILKTYIDHLLEYISPKEIRPLKLVVNAGNGAAGHVVDELEKACQRKRIPLEFVKLNNNPDGNFPNGIPNPLLPENRTETAKAVISTGADIGIAWDGDFDRCFLFDEQGQFVEAYYIVGLLAQSLLASHPGEKILYDPRLTWNTQDMVSQHGGTAIQCKTGHAFIKERMREEGALYGGEMSGHHYFRDFANCDSGMIPWLLVIELMSRRNQPLSVLVNERTLAYPCSGEINFTVDDPIQIMESIQQHYQNGDQDYEIDTCDGLGINFENWRFNLRCSNTEPLLRLNVETRANPELLQSRLSELKKMIRNQV